MELDVATLRISFGVVALTTLVLFFFVTYRSTRSAYSVWWCVALTFFISGSGAYLLNGTDQQQWANPAGNGLLVLGAASTWAAARSLAPAAIRWPYLAAAPVLTLIVSFADDPATDVWSGGAVFLAMMSLMFGLCARELWRLDRDRTQIRASVAVAATLICAYYVGRCLTFIVDGAEGEIFTHYFGSSVTTVVTLVFLVVVSFSMTLLSNEQTTELLQIRATRDGLTGILNRTEFLRLATDEVHLLRHNGASAALVLVDLDRFKEVNDTHGHQAGDRVLQAFARAAARTVRSSDLVGRYGGEEFILLLPRTNLDRAEQVTKEISVLLSDVEETVGFEMPTASYGIATTETDSLEAAIAIADTALYRAKALGRNCAVRCDWRESPAAESTVDGSVDHRKSSS